jgi:uncharacterized membrane protein
MTDTPPVAEGSGAPGGKWRALLMASLALNLVVAGIAASHTWQHRQLGRAGSAGNAGEFGLHGFLRDLPRERAKELRALIKGERPDLKPLVEMTRAARRTAADTLAARTFDKDKLVEAFGKIDLAEANVKAAARSVVVTAASHMTAEERLQLAERWKSKRARYFHGPSAPNHGRRDDRVDDEAAAPATLEPAAPAP